MNYITNVLFFFVLSTFSIQIYAQAQSASPVVLRVNPNKTIGGKLGDLFEEIKFVPLETSKKSLFGEIFCLKIVEGKIIFLDFNTKSILGFGDNGSYQFRLTEKSFDEKPLAPLFFTIQEAPKPTINVEVSNYLYKFDLNGKRLEKALIKKQSKDLVIPIFSQKKVFYFYKDSSGKNEIYDLAIADKQNKDVKFFPSTQRAINSKSEYMGSFTENYTDSSFYFSRPYDYNIYKINQQNNLFKAYSFIFPNENALPADFESNPTYDKPNTRRNLFISNNQIISSIQNFYYLGNYLIFNAIANGGLMGKHVFAYNSANNALISLLNLEPDKASFYLPVFSEKFYRGNSDFPFLAYDGKYFYTSISALEIFQGKELRSGVQYNPELMKFFKEQSSQSNPVLVRLLPKTGL